MADTWSPSTYLQFEDERTRPARDLLAQVPLVELRKAFDIGCGPGNSTMLLLERYPDAEIIGIDSSPAMLEEAMRTVPAARFEQGDANVWLPDREADLVFGNAIYHWVPDHLQLFSRVLHAMRPGAVLAVQMPDNLAEPTHRLMNDVASDSRWRTRLAGAARDPLPMPRVYYEALEASAARVDIWHTVYNHVLDGPDAIVDWVRGTGLRPFLDPLSSDERADFLQDYRTRIAAAYPPLAAGRVMLRFPRLFLVAVR
jgi:trans-aconitate 2-methyltransferase